MKEKRQERKKMFPVLAFVMAGLLISFIPTAVFAVTIEGTVTDEEYLEGIPYAWIWAESADWDYDETGTDEFGDFTLELTEGDWMLYAEPPFDPYYFQYGSKEQSLTVESVMEPVTITLPLYEFGISGTITGTDASEVYIDAYNEDAEDSYRYTLSEAGNYKIWLHNADTGTWEVSVYQENDVNWVAPAPQEVDFTGADTILDLNFPPAEAYLSGTVTADGSPLQDGPVSIEYVNLDDGSYRYADINTDGTFNIPLLKGIYEISVWVDEELGYGGPFLGVIPVDGDAALENVPLLTENAAISGRVTDGSTGLANIFLDLWNENGDWNFAETDTGGNYTINVFPGTWTVVPWTEDSGYIYTGDAQEVVAAPEGRADFILEASRLIEGSVWLDSSRLTTLDDAWAYARKTGEFNPFTVVPVENGTFFMEVPAGISVWVGLQLNPEYPFSLIREKEVQTTESTVNLYLQSDTAKISGYLKSGDTPVTGLEGYVYADNPELSIFKQTEIKSDGSYEIMVPADSGTWNLSYELDSDNYVSGVGGGLQAEAGNTQADITLYPLDNIFDVSVQNPDETTPAPNIRVWVNCVYNDGAQELVYEDIGISNSSGVVTFKVPSGWETTVGASPYDDIAKITGEARSGRYSGRRRSPPPRRVRFGKRSGPEELVLRESNAVLNGTVSGISGAKVFVTAYSGDGQMTFAYTDTSGEYALDIAKGETNLGNYWTLIARCEKDGDYYASDPVFLDITGLPTPINVPLINLRNRGAWPVKSEHHEFKISNGWNYSLSDGSQISIPPNAMRITKKGKEEKTLKINIKPRISGLPDNMQYRLIDYGYEITARGKNTGKKVLSKFDKKVTMILRYNKEKINALGIGADQIRPAYLLPDTNSWMPVNGFTNDKTAGKITFQTDHFSVWALVAENSYEPGNVDGSSEATGNITLTDAILSLQISAGMTPEVPVYKTACVNGDLRIGPEEAVYILQKIANLRK